MSIVDTELVTVDLAACQRVADWIASREIPLDAEETSLQGLSHLEVGDLYLFLVAICHQTSPLGMPPLLGAVGGKERRGWDFLLARFVEIAAHDRSVLSPGFWRGISGKQLSAMFSDPNRGSRLIQTERRAALIHDLASTMAAHGWKHLEDVFRLAHGRVATGSPNLIDLLSKFEAYRDPVHKKAFYLLALMKNHGIWNYVDPDRLGAPVDYHEIRGHLRLGTVSLVSQQLKTKLRLRQPVDEAEDLAIRQAVFTAIGEISDRSGIREPSRLHYLFWNVFRSCCQRSETHCEACPPNCPLPSRYVPLAESYHGRGCPFRFVCQSAKDPQRRQLIEHVVSTEYDFH